MRKVIVVLVGVLVLLGSCNGTSEKDTSLTLKEYRDSGLPDPHKIWETNDFALANAVLVNIKNTKPQNLPIKDSKKSGVIFSRMISMENFPFLQDHSLSNSAKLILTKDFLIYCENWIKLYTFSGAEQKYYHQELTFALLFGLDITQIMLNLDENIQVMNHAEEMENELDYNPTKSVYFSGLFNLLRTQSNAKQFSKADNEVITDHVVSSINQNKAWMDDAIKSDLKEALQATIGGINSEYTTLKYDDLAQSL